MGDLLMANDALINVGWTLIALLFGAAPLIIVELKERRALNRRIKLTLKQHAAHVARRDELIAERNAKEKAQAQKAAPQPPAQHAGLTIPLPRPAPTVPLPRRTPEAVKGQQPPKPPANSHNATAPLPARTQPVQKPSVKLSTPPGSAPAPWQVEGLQRFRNLRVIGSGGFADVLYGEDEAGLPQAIKVLRMSGSEKELAAKLFRREARILSSLRSPSIPRLISSHVDAPRPHFSMEYIEGLNLRDHVQAKGPIVNPAELLGLANSTAEALAEIHECGFLHRDIKPLNVMASPSGFKLLDLGIGKDLQSPSTSSAGRMGTLAFMAPEYMNGHDATAATDVFSWGAMMGFAMTGTLPYGDHPEHVLMSRVREGRLDGRFLQALEDFKLLGVTHQMLAYLAGASTRIDPGHRDLNFLEVLRVLKRLNRPPRRR